MKNIFILTALISLAFFTSCDNQKMEDDLQPTKKGTPSLLSMDKNNSPNNNMANIGAANFLVNNVDHYLHEGDALLLSNNSVNAVSYHWDFGNGDTSSSAQPNYEYEIHGNYTVTLTVKDAFNKSHQTSHDIVVLCVFGGGDHNQ